MKSVAGCISFRRTVLVAREDVNGSYSGIDRSGRLGLSFQRLQLRGCRSWPPELLPLVYKSAKSKASPEQNVNCSFLGIIHIMYDLCTDLECLCELQQHRQPLYNSTRQNLHTSIRRLLRDARSGSSCATNATTNEVSNT